MRIHRTGVIASGVLCAIAATVAIWSGPLAAATADLHASAGATTHHHIADTHQPATSASK